MQLKQLIVGWNRGGLGYVHELLNKSGFDAGLTFGPKISLEEALEKLPQAKPYEVSPYVVPYIGHEAFKHVRVVFVLRDPLRVFNSLYFHGLFHNEKHSAVQHSAFKHLQGFKQKYKGRPAQASCSYLNHWIRMAANNRRNLKFVRIEEGPRKVLKAITGSTIDNPPFVPPTINASYCKQTIVPSKLPEQCQWGMKNLLFKYGYREWAWIPRGGHAHYVNPDWHC